MLAQDGNKELAATEYAAALKEYEEVARIDRDKSAQIRKEIAALRALMGQAP